MAAHPDRPYGDVMGAAPSFHGYTPPHLNQTFASRIAVCRECGAQASSLYLDPAGKSRIFPCGHAADLILKPNPAVIPPL